ncbi:hypothetical protein M8C21_000830 [Ambrosia artemisiifolia]|uniref:Peptide deformylase n=1 Tax=Ambrosia artemisiifolia TaxID=4212 RepID=A0AAD5GG76_AMBAR|nr:hypothetical protein M8C21_000830 [Ambrosia artemisiifolia]
MAYANWLQSSPLSHVTFPTTTHRQDTIPATFRPTRQSIFSSNYRYRPPPITVQAQPKRVLLQKNQDEPASLADMAFESPLKIVMYPDPILRAKNKRVVTFDDNLKKLVDEMFDVMYKTDGIGLSAPQVGVNVQLMVFNPAGERGEGEEIVLVNPRVVKSSKKQVPFTEGCLSFPGINADVVFGYCIGQKLLRLMHKTLLVQSFQLAYHVSPQGFSNTSLIIWRQGILFFDRMTAEVVESIRAELLALEQKYEDRTGLVRPESVESRKRWKAAAGFGRS